MDNKAFTNKTWYELELERLAALQYAKPHWYTAVRRSRTYINQHYDEPLALDKLAVIACMSRFHFIRTFRRVYGLTPGAYLRDVRIQKAQQLLLSGMPVAEVCYKVGYSSLPTFSTVFRLGVGLSPLDYKKSNPG